MLIGFHRMAEAKAHYLIDLISNMKDPLYKAITIGPIEPDVVYFQIIAPEMDIKVTNASIYIEMENEIRICKFKVYRDEYEHIEIIN